MDCDLIMLGGLYILVASPGICCTEPDSFGMNWLSCRDDIEVFIAGETYLSLEFSMLADCCFCRTCRNWS